MKSETIQTIFDNILLSECSFNNEYLTIDEFEYKDFYLSFQYNLCDNGFVYLSLYKNQTLIQLSLKHKNYLVSVIEELKNNYLENEEEYKKQYKEHLNNICESAYFIQ